MRTHPVDLTSLVWGIVLATITGLLAVLVFTDTTLDLGVLVPAALICAGLLVLITALLRWGPSRQRVNWIADPGSAPRAAHRNRLALARQAEAGLVIDPVCRRNGVSGSTALTGRGVTMTDTLMGVSPPPEPAGAGDAEDRELSPAELAAVEDLVRQARHAGIALTGPDGLLKQLTKTVLETALDEEMTEHLGYDKHAASGRTGNSRNGTRSKTVLTEGPGRSRSRCPATGTARSSRRSCASANAG